MLSIWTVALLSLPSPGEVPAVTGWLAVLVAGLACCGAWFARGTTAVPAAWWAVTAALAVAADAFGQQGGGQSPSVMAAARVVVAALSVCPIMALLGAKRPQHGVWQLIVATLAVVLALPAVTATLIRPGSFPDLHLLARWFLPILMLVGWMNFIGTRRWLAVSLITAGQFGLLWPLLPGVDLAAAVPQPGIDLAAMAAVAAGGLLALGQTVLAGGRPRGRRAAEHLVPDQRSLAKRVDGCFLPLRETLGAAWALRLAERFDTLAAQRGWPARLTFQGLEQGGDPTDASWHRDAARAAEALFRRFVSSGWLRRHGWWEADEAEASEPADVSPETNS